MSNQHQAARLIHEWQQRHKNRFDLDPEWYAQSIAIELDNEGLLAPDLPEPTFSFDDGTKAWLVKDDEVRDIAATYIFDGEILLSTAAGKVKGAPEKMRKIGLALLAATNHTEEV